MKLRYNSVPFKPASSPVFYGWAVVVWGTLGILMSAPGQTMGIATFTDHLIEAFDLTRNQLSLAYMLGTILSSLILTHAGKLYDRIGARWLGVMATLLMGIVLAFMSQSDRLAFALARLFNLQEVQYIFGFVVIMLGFFLLRFSGQGVLTMLSRNMIMKWFVRKRGLANGISNVFVALGFSIAPLHFDRLIEAYSWRGAWIILALAAGLGFSIIILIFFRDNPEDCGLQPDGDQIDSTQESKIRVKPVKQFSLKEAKRTLPFWMFSFSLALNSLFVTGFSFNIVSIFEKSGMDKIEALSIFVPISVIAVVVTLGSGWLSDFIKLKKLLIFNGIGQLLAMAGVAFLAVPFFRILLILGSGIMWGIFSVLAAVVWPRFYGRENLGAISGFSMSLIVFASSIGPLLFSFSLSRLGSYAPAAIICSVISLAILIGSFKADNPQDILS